MLQSLALFITDIMSFAILCITSTFRLSVRSFSSYLAPNTWPRTSPSPLPAHYLFPPIGPVPTPTLDRLRVLCRPVFEQEQLNNPKLAWAGAFQSNTVSQHPYSIINLLVGFDAVDNLDVVYSSCRELEKKLTEILGMEVNLMEFIQNDNPHVRLNMDALLIAETIWGPPLWKLPSREAAKRLLKKEYETTKKALQAAYRLKERLVSYMPEYESLKNETVRLSILEDALFVIPTVQAFHGRLYDKLMPITSQLEGKKRAICAGKEGAVVSNEDIKDIRYAIFSCHIVEMLKGDMYEAEQIFSCAGFKP